MTDEERHQLIGKVVTERSQSKREMALVSRRIKDGGDLLYRIGIILTRESEPDYDHALELIGQTEGLAWLAESIAERRVLSDKIREFSQLLHDAGAE